MTSLYNQIKSRLIQISVIPYCAGKLCAHNYSWQATAKLNHKGCFCFQTSFAYLQAFYFLISSPPQLSSLEEYYITNINDCHSYKNKTHVVINLNSPWSCQSRSPAACGLLSLSMLFPLSNRKGSWESWHPSWAAPLIWGRSCTTTTPGWNSSTWTSRSKATSSQTWTQTVSCTAPCPPTALPFLLASEMMTQVGPAAATQISPATLKHRLSILSSQIKPSARKCRARPPASQAPQSRAPPLESLLLQHWAERLCTPRWVRWGRLARCCCRLRNRPRWRKPLAKTRRKTSWRRRRKQRKSFSSWWWMQITGVTPQNSTQGKWARGCP